MTDPAQSRAPVTPGADFTQGLLAEMPRLKRQAFNFTRNRDTAEDLVQETMLKALQKAHLFNPGSNLGAWLHTILRNTFLTKLRKDNRFTHEDETFWEALPAPDSMPDAGLMLEDALGAMSPQQREIVLDMHLVGLTYEQMAEKYAVPMGTIKSRLNRSKAAAKLQEPTPRRRMHPALPPAPKGRPMLDTPRTAPPPALPAPDSFSEEKLLERLCRYTKSHKKEFNELIKPWLNQAEISYLAMSDIFIREGVGSSRTLMNNIMYGLGAWNEDRLRVMLREVKKTVTEVAIELFEDVREAARQQQAQQPLPQAAPPAPQPLSQPAPAPRAPAAPDARPEPKSTLDMLETITRRLLRELMANAALTAEQKTARLGEVIQLLTRP